MLDSDFAQEARVDTLERRPGAICPLLGELLSSAPDAAIAVLDGEGHARHWTPHALAAWGPAAPEHGLAGLEESALGAAAAQIRAYPNRTVEVDLGDRGLAHIYGGESGAMVVCAASVASTEAERMRLLGRQMALGFDHGCVWDWDLRQGTVHYSTRWKAMLGYGDAEIGDSVDERVSRLHCDDRDRVQQQLRLALLGDTGSFEAEYRLRHRDGEWRRVLSQGRVVLWTPDGRPSRAIGTDLDITGQGRHAEDIAGDATYQRQLFDVLPANACVIDPHGRIIQVNRAWTSFCCSNRGDVERTDVGINYLEICDAACGSEADEAHLAAAGIRAVIAGERERFHLVYPCHSPDEERWYELRAAPIPGPTPRAVVIGHLDVTRLQKIEAQVHVLEHAVSSANDGIVIADASRPDHPAVYVNGAFERITGLRSDEAIGRNCFFLPSADADQSALAELHAALDADRPSRVTLRNYRKDGEVFWNSLSIAPVFDIHGARTHHIGIMSDVSERIRAAERLQRIAGHVPGTIFHFRMRANANAGFEYLSGGLRDLVGLPSDAVLADPTRLLAVIHPEDFERLRASVLEAGARMTPWRGEFRVRLGDGRSRWIECNATPIGSPGGTMDWYGHATDVETRKQSEQLRERAMVDLQQRNRDLQDFASVASHDLQEPLRKIRIFGDRLTANLDGLDAGQRDALLRMVGAASRMSTLVDDLLDYSRAGIAIEGDSKVELEQVLRDVLEDLDQQIASADAEFDAGPLPVVRGDCVQLRQLFQNLIGNALKFRQPGRRCRISIGWEPLAASTGGPGTAGWARIWISDNGIGFPNEKAESLFAPFRRLHSQAEYEGTGIGLAIVRRIVERHGGRITARGQPGLGATFIVELPLSSPSAD